MEGRQGLLEEEQRGEALVLPVDPARFPSQPPTLSGVIGEATPSRDKAFTGRNRDRSKTAASQRILTLAQGHALVQAKGMRQKHTIDRIMAGTSMGFMAPKLLVFGCVLGLMGFFLVFAVMVTCELETIYAPKEQVYRECSDYRPLPMTVSELVHKWDSASGRIFFALELVAGLSIYFSSYGFCFSNCACDCYVMTPFKCANWCMHELDIRWCDLRQFVPPVGLMLVALLPTIPIYQLQGIHDTIMVGCHCAAAFMLFLGAAIVEWHFFRYHARQESDVSSDSSGESESEEDQASPVSVQSTQPSLVRNVSGVDLGLAEIECRRPPKVPQQEDMDRVIRKMKKERHIYVMKWRENLSRKFFNLASIGFFTLFIMFQVWLKLEDCRSSTFLRAGRGQGTCMAQDCDEIDHAAMCDEANIRFVDQVHQKYANGEPSASGQVLKMIDAKPWTVPDMVDRGLSFGAYLGHGCWMRTVGCGSGDQHCTTSFVYIDHEDMQTPIEFGRGKKTEREHKASFYRTCMCGVHGSPKRRQSTVFDAFKDGRGNKLFAVGTRHGRLVHQLKKELDRNARAKKLGKQPALGLAAHSAVQLLDGPDAKLRRASEGDLNPEDRNPDIVAEKREAERALESDALADELATFNPELLGGLSSDFFKPGMDNGGFTAIDLTDVPLRPFEHGGTQRGRPGFTPPRAGETIESPVETDTDQARTDANEVGTGPSAFTPRSTSHQEDDGHDAGRDRGPGSSFDPASGRSNRRGRQRRDEDRRKGRRDAEEELPVADTGALPEREDPESPHAGSIKDTIKLTTVWEGERSPVCTFITVGSFVSEVVAGLACVCVHAIIWYYAPERWVHPPARRQTELHAQLAQHRTIKANKGGDATPAPLTRPAQW